MLTRQSEFTIRSLSLRAQAFKLLLRILRRKSLYASVDGVTKGIKQARDAGPTRPKKKLLRHATVQLEQIEECEVYTLKPKNGASSETILYLHGGGYIRPITSFHWDFLQWLVSTRRSTVVVPLYPLAPESKCINTLAAVRAIHDCAVKRHGAFDAFIGDSAGAGLCLALCQDIKATGNHLSSRLVLLTPFVDATMRNPNIAETDQRDLMLGPEGLLEAGRLFAGELPLDHPLVSPIKAKLEGFPPMQIFVARDDILSHDALLFAGRAREAGVQVELHIGDGLMHVWPLLPITEAQRSREAINKFL
jgi:acetyl esterase/lipase